MFEPNLRLIREFDGEFTLQALTLTPSACWQAGVARATTPPQVLLLPEVQGVILEMRHDAGPCTQAVNPVRHCLSNLQLGDQHGKTTIAAFVMHGDQILGSSDIDVRQLGQTDQGPAQDQTAIINTFDWYAWVNRMPGGDPSFFVTGSVTLANPGFRVSLQPSRPQGINPRQLLMNLEVERLPGMWPQVVTTRTVRYEISPYQNNYDGVLIQLPDGRGIRLDIEEVY